MSPAIPDGPLVFWSIFEYENGELIATPLYNKSANISILNKAKGYTLIKESKEGLKVKEMIEVVLL